MVFMLKNNFWTYLSLKRILIPSIYKKQTIVRISVPKSEGTKHFSKIGETQLEPVVELQLISKISGPSKRFAQYTFRTTALTVRSAHPVTIYSIYLPNSLALDEIDLENIINQLPIPFILCGDFNSHNTLWVSEVTDNRGKTV